MKMKALFAIKSLNVPGGGAERVMTQIVNSLVDREYDMFVVTFDKPERSFYPLSSAVTRVDLGLGTAGQSMPRAALMRALPRLRSVVGSMQPDIVVAFMHSMYIPLGLALFGTKFRLIASEHAGIEHYDSRPMERAILSVTPMLSVGSTIPSGNIRAGFPPRLQRRMTVMPNPIFAPASTTVTAAGPEDRKTVLAVGRLSAEKNQSELIDAFALLADEFEDWELRIVGDGDLRHALEAQVARAGLSSRVSLPGVIEDIHAEYCSASFVAVPSRYESFGLVAAEALSVGRPVIGFADCPGTNELITDQVNGLLVPGDGDRTTTFAAGLRQLMSDTELRERLAAAGPPSVSKYDLESIVDRWEALLLQSAACGS